jgi:hypothetical protein
MKEIHPPAFRISFMRVSMIGSMCLLISIPLLFSQPPAAGHGHVSRGGLDRIYNYAV